MTAYWISPKGEIIDVKQNHINVIISNPEKFGFNIEFIEYVYNHYNEKIGLEGKAREQLIVALFNEVWIRIRKYRNFYSINVKRLAGRNKSYVYQWANKILKGLHGFKEQDPYAEVRMDQKGKKIKITDIKSIADSDKFVSEHILIETKIHRIKNIDPYPIVKEILTVGLPRKQFEDFL